MHTCCTIFPKSCLVFLFACTLDNIHIRGEDFVCGCPAWGGKLAIISQSFSLCLMALVVHS